MSWIEQWQVSRGRDKSFPNGFSADDMVLADGFHYGAEGWSNFGQVCVVGVIHLASSSDPPPFTLKQKGAPETGDIPGAAPKPTILDMGKHGHLIHEYGPTTGIQELRGKVAEYYNDTFRTKKESKYTAENICIVPGGRAGLSRVASVISPILLGYQLPEYAAYEPMCGSSPVELA